jgi:hypothetical protein
MPRLPSLNVDAARQAKLIRHLFEDVSKESVLLFRIEKNSSTHLVVPSTKHEARNTKRIQSTSNECSKQRNVVSMIWI